MESCKIDRFAVDINYRWYKVRDLAKNESVVEVNLLDDTTFNYVFAKASKEIIEEYLRGEFELDGLDDRTLYQRLRQKLSR